MVLKLVEQLHKTVEAHEKHVIESVEHAHTDKLMQMRVESHDRFVTDHYPEGPKRNKMLEHLHAIRKLSHEALEHKE